MLVLILRSAHVEDVRQTSNACARVSKDEDETVCPHASRRIAAQRCWGGGVLCDAPQHEGRGRTAHFGGTKPMGSMPACSIRNRPAVAGSDRRRRSIASGLLFTMNGATRTGIWRSSETLAPAKRGEGGERRRREPGEGQLALTQLFRHPRA